MDWQQESREAVRDPQELARALGLELSQLPPLPQGGFPFLVPRSFAARMEPGNPRDPLLLQVWPDARESVMDAQERLDPVGDGPARTADGLLHKYQGRVLLVTTGACAVHCRYCFRQNYPYRDEPHALDAWRPALEHVADDPSIHEVLLSGGDPLTLPDAVLSRLVAEIEAIPHVRTLRIHTRLPVVIPSRVTEEFCRILSNSRLRCVVVLHANHARELGTDVAEACARLRSHGVMILNQSVLLAGVNDRLGTIEDLSHGLWAMGVLPYYLHVLDAVKGSRRFAVDDAEAAGLIEELRTRLPGYLVPRLVREIEGEASKTRLA
jgi:L-lysine 2,3-aminomutase